MRLVPQRLNTKCCFYTIIEIKKTDKTPENHQKKRVDLLSEKVLVTLLILVLIGSNAYIFYQKEQLNTRNRELHNHKADLQNKITSYKQDISSLNRKVSNLDRDISSKKGQIATLEKSNTQKQEEIDVLRTAIKEREDEIDSLTDDLDQKKTELRTTTFLYEEAKEYQERVNRGQRLSSYHTLLNDREEYAKPIILEYLGLSKPREPANDEELWERGRQVYNWLSDNYEYCGDKGLRVGNTFYQFQFYSPDELLLSDNARCGDCDDFATLFAGMMYASGVSEDKVWVVCGDVSGNGHCWNRLVLSSGWYRVDGVCSQRSTVLNFLGLDLGMKQAYYTSEKKHVDCMRNYNAAMRMNPETYQEI